jgi:antitoxin (DNA-binding transcriptional repressor) of toxin-antitoxin stability system
VRRCRTGAAIACHLALTVCPWLVVSARAEPANIPAVIVDPSAESRSELSRVVREALHGVPVTLADDALTTTNLLAIEHASPRDSAARRLNGRELSRPETFELFKRESHCVLVRSKTGHAWTLHHTRCAAVPRQTSDNGSPKRRRGLGSNA